MLLVIVRHGETDANISRVLQGHLDSELSLRGILQVKKLAERLEEKKFDQIFCSDLIRARQTAAAILQGRNTPIVYRSELRERSYGVYQGQPLEKFEEALKNSGQSREEFCPEKGESYLDVEKRVATFLDEIFATHESQSVLLVAHGGTNRVILKQLLQKSFSEVFRIEQNNTCINEIDIAVSSKTIVAQTLNCTAHLSSRMFTPFGIQE